MVRELRENGSLLKDLDYISEAEAAIALNVSEQTLIDWRKRQIGPPFSMIGRKFIYAVAKLKQWVEAGGTRTADEALKGGRSDAHRAGSAERRRAGRGQR